MHVGRRVVADVAATVVVMFLVVVLCASALASQPGVPASFGSFGEGAGQFEEPHGIAVDQQAGVDGTNGNVFVVDRNNGRVDEFSGDGEFVRAWGWGVVDGNAAFETCTVTSGCHKGIAGAGAGQLSEGAEGVAVDNSGPLPDLSHGDVYVTDAGNERVEKFSAEGVYLGTFGNEGSSNGQFEGPRPIAVDAEGHVYVGDNTRVQKFSEAGAYEATVVSGVGAIEGLAVAPNGDIYVLSSGQAGVREYESSGKEVAPVRDEAGRPRLGMALDGTGDLFVNDEENSVHHILEYEPAGAQTESFDRGPHSRGAEQGMAFGESAEALYLVNGGATPQVRIVSLPAPGPLIFQEGVSAQPQPQRDARVEAEINPEGADTEYLVEYGTTSGLGSKTAPQTLAASFAESTVSVELGGLEFATEYHYCVVASNAHGRSPCVQKTFRSRSATSIDALWTSNVAVASATFVAEVNPEETASTCRFEYASAAAYATDGAFEHAVAASAIVAPADADVIVSAQVGEGEGLAPATEFAYRVSCEKEGTTDASAVQTLRTQSTHAGIALPDQRLMETVASGVGKPHITTPQFGGLPQISASGEAVVYGRTAPGSSAESNYQTVELARHRQPSGWSSVDIVTPYSQVAEQRSGLGTEYRLFSADLSASIVAPWDANPLAPGAAERTPYRRTETAAGEPTFEPLLTAADVTGSPAFRDAVNIVGANADVTDVALKSSVPLTAGSVTEGLYEWSGDALANVSVLEQAGASESVAGVLGSLFEGTATTRGAVSADGTLVYWTPEGRPGLYVRDTASGESLRLDAPQGVVPAAGEGEEPRFQLASSDGRRVFFTDTQRLTAKSTATVGAPDLYQCQIITPPAGPLSCRISDITAEVLHIGEHAGVQGLIGGASEAGTRVYFVATGMLASGATTGEDNLYTAVEDEGGWRIAWIATLSAQDRNDWASSLAGLLDLTDHSSADGRWFAFMSQNSLTGYDNRDAASGEPDEEAYLYDAQSGRLSCVSCDPTGARPHGINDRGLGGGSLIDARGVWEGRRLAGALAAWQSVGLLGELTSYLPDSLSDAGRLFFESATSLSPQASNGVFGVYEFEPVGVGSCTEHAAGFSSATGGCVALISPGGAPGDAAFLGASTSGDDAFIMSTAGNERSEGSLPPYSIFDVHSCEAGSSWSCPAATPVPLTGCESASGCREGGNGVAGGGLESGAIGSEGLEGAGNLAGHGKAGKAGGRPGASRRAVARCRRMHPHGGARLRACLRRAHKHRGGVLRRLAAAGLAGEPGMYAGLAAVGVLIAGLILREDARDGQTRERGRRRSGRYSRAKARGGRVPRGDRCGSASVRLVDVGLWVRLCIGLSVAVLAMWWVSVGIARAVEPWWHISTVSRPTNMWVSQPEVQDVHIGSLMVVEVEKLSVACVGKLSSFCPSFAGMASTATPAELQEKLEVAYGLAGGVDASEVEPGVWQVTTPGQFVPGIEAGKPNFGGSVSVKGGSGQLTVVVTNLGDAEVNGGGGGGPVRINDVLPPGFVALQAEAVAGQEGKFGTLACSPAAHGSEASCSFGGELPAYESIEMEVDAAVRSSAPAEGVEDGEVSVAGGNAGAMKVAQPARVSSARTPFGLEHYSFVAEEEGGGADSQAGSHPFQLTSVVDLNQGRMSGANHHEAVEEQPALPRNFRFRLPVGLVGNASSVAQCSETVFDVTQCPADTAVGVAAATFIEHSVFGLTTMAVPVFNLTPTAGEPARFGFTPAGVPVVLDISVRSGEAYGVTVSVSNTSQLAQLLGSVVSLWGVPGDPRHDSARGGNCVGELEGSEKCVRPEGLQETPFLRLPTSCGSLLRAPMELEPWNVPLGSQIIDEEAVIGKLDGCNKVPFEPTLGVAPSTSRAATPTGLTVHLKAPQEASTDPAGIAEADVRNTTIALPPNLQINPAAAAGLHGCSEAQIGYLHTSPAGEPVFSEESPEEEHGEKPHGTGCPEGSQLGTVRIDTPLLKEPLTGAVYQAAQNANPFGSLLALYLVAEAPNAGVRLRLAGEVHVEPNGQLVSKFPQTPQTPFGEFTLKFFEGPKAALATTGCGTYTTTSLIEPWSSTPASPFTATPSSFFEVSSGPGGASCSGLDGFVPSFAAGTTNNNGGSFSPLKMTIGRKDGEQTLSTVSVKMPPGLAGMISSVQPCPEAQANTGDCPAASKIGHVRVSAGVGSEPIALPEAGKPEDPVYLTGPYKSAPFGIAIVAPAEAGPFNLGTVVVRGTISIDPHTAQVTIQTEPMPTRLQGVPLDVRDVEVVVDRPGFMFNPTNCEPLSITGTIGSSESASETVKNRFESANCVALPFKPSFKVFSHARHTRRNGAYLRVKVTSGKGQANIKSVYVELPKILPSRAETLRLACSETQFATNPAGCPAGSHVGTAIARTPVLPTPLTGSAIFVSHGGAAFPDLDVVLQGDGVTIELEGQTNIQGGITSSTFKSVPDVPVNSFELTLSPSSHSALAAEGNLCFKTTHKRGRTIRKRVKLIMPTTITGQNGAVVKQSTIIKVQGCGKAAHRRGRHKKK